MTEAVGSMTPAAVADDTTELPVQDRAAGFRPSAAGWAARLAVAGGIVAAIFALPVVVSFDFQADLISTAAIFAMVGLSMNVLVGYLGQLSLGHQAFYGIGAFASAIVATRWGLPFGLGLAAAALTGALSALLLGGIALRVKGLYLAIVTLAYGLLAEVSIFRVGFLEAGVFADRPAFAMTSRAYAYLCLGALALFFLLDVRLLKSKAGRAIQAIRDDERVAASFGINVTGFKLLAFVISGTMAGLAGALFAHQLGTVSAENQFDLTLALTFVLMAVVGGLGNRVGVIIGSVVFAILPNLLALVVDALNAVLPAFLHVAEPDPVVEPVIGAGLLILTLIQFPGGIGQQIAPIQRWIRGGRFDIHAMKDRSQVGGGMVGRP